MGNLMGGRVYYVQLENGTGESKKSLIFLIGFNQ